MFSEKEQKRTIEVLGKHYSNSVIEYLQTKKILNAKGKPFSQSSIRLVVNRVTENKMLELEILKLVDKTERSNITIANRRKKYIAKTKK